LLGVLTSKYISQQKARGSFTALSRLRDTMITNGSFAFDAIILGQFEVQAKSPFACCHVADLYDNARYPLNVSELW